jgi:putative membrane protein
MSLLIRAVLVGVGLYIADYFLSGVSIDAVWPSLVVASLALTLVLVVVRPIIKIITLPINIMTLGLFSVLLNTLFFWFVARLIAGFSVNGFDAAFLGALIVGVVYSIGTTIFVRD